MPTGTIPTATATSQLIQPARDLALIAVFAGVTARATWELVERAPAGLYHVAGAERLSRWRIGELLAARWPELRPRLEAASLRDYAGQPRPPDTSLNCAKAQRSLSFSLPRFSSWLAENREQAF